MLQTKLFSVQIVETFKQKSGSACFSSCSDLNNLHGRIEKALDVLKICLAFMTESETNFRWKRKTVWDM